MLPLNLDPKALVIGLGALGIGEGDEVITTPCIFLCHSRIDEQWGPSQFLESKVKIPLRIKSRMLIRLSGQSAVMEQIMEMAQG